MNTTTTVTLSPSVQRMIERQREKCNAAERVAAERDFERRRGYFRNELRAALAFELATPMQGSQERLATAIMAALGMSFFQAMDWIESMALAGQWDENAVGRVEDAAAYAVRCAGENAYCI